jgi:hypothetical protein
VPRRVSIPIWHPTALPLRGLGVGSGLQIIRSSQALDGIGIGDAIDEQVYAPGGEVVKVSVAVEGDTSTSISALASVTPANFRACVPIPAMVFVNCENALASRSYPVPSPRYSNGSPTIGLPETVVYGQPGNGSDGARRRNGGSRYGKGDLQVITQGGAKQ